ncbi:hypothetical protein ACQ86N_08540 [Puia sp. P3]|uniref:hypothetical protein n=1 Tax=Puia sp. P3 TaxID=3423952 RepID=UPI003D6781A9
MKKFIAFCLIVSCVVIVSCSKSSSGPDQGHGSNSLFPLALGDQWDYVDSSFSDTGLAEIGHDTMTVNSQRLQDNFGTTYVGITNPGDGFRGAIYRWILPIRSSMRWTVLRIHRIRSFRR